MKKGYFILGGIAVAFVVMLIFLATLAEQEYTQSQGLEVKISTAKDTYSSGEPIVVDVQLNNIGNQKIQVLDLIILENYPYTFDIIDANGDRIDFLGFEIMFDYEDNHFVILNPGQSLVHQVNLKVDEYGVPRYNLNIPGTYSVTATYWPPFERTFVDSNIIMITLQ